MALSWINSLTGGGSILNPIKNKALHAGAAAAGTVFDYLTPGSGSNRLTDWGIGATNGQSASSSPGATSPTPSVNSSSSAASLADKYKKEYEDALAAINANRTPVPRFVNFDLAGSYNKAREMAVAAKSPIYQQKMTDFINRQVDLLTRKQQDVVTEKSALDTAMERLTGDVQLGKARAGEDAATNITDINAARAFDARSEGLNFDAANRSINEGVGAANIADSGLGQQQVQENQAVRRGMSNEAVRQTANKVEAQNTLMNRTFDDLSLKETRAGEDTSVAKTKVDVDLERFIADQSLDRDQNQKLLDLQKEADVATATNTFQGQLVDQWLASLAGKGYTAQEIANAAAMYK